MVIRSVNPRTLRFHNSRLPGRRDACNSRRVRLQLIRASLQQALLRKGFLVANREKKKTPLPEILSGWKNIAGHLGMGVRTIQRYEREMGLPIRRPAGRMRGSVLATKSELDAWVASSPIRAAFQLAKRSQGYSPVDLASLRRGVAEMSALREQTAALRREVRTSMLSLKNSIKLLQGDLRTGHWEIPPVPVLEHNPQTRLLAEWTSMETKNRKVS